MRARPRAPSFLGTGWSFPPTFTQGGKEVDLVADEEDIHQSLQILLATSRGERPMQESYGCNLDSLLFEEMDQGLVNNVTNLIQDAILVHEPRVKLLRVEVTPRSAGVLQIKVEYSIRGTNSRFNMVFPFYLNEAVTPGI